MKTKITTALFLSLLFSASVLAETPCVECRKEAMLKVAACQKDAQTKSEKDACTKKAQDLTKACNEGACKDMKVK
jgi:hypothetical protein